MAKIINSKVTGVGEITKLLLRAHKTESFYFLLEDEASEVALSGTFKKLVVVLNRFDCFNFRP